MMTRVAGCVRPVPWGVVESHVDVSDRGDTASAAGPNTGTMCRFSRAIGNEHKATQQRFGGTGSR
jgi:hypothetical protein